MSTQNFRIKNGLTVNGNNYPSVGPLSNRNKIINGNMSIDQRFGGTAATFGAGAAYVLDRWQGATTIASNMRVQQVTDAPAGFSHSQKIDAVTGASIGPTEYFAMIQKIEAYNVFDLEYGTSDAKTTTLSFYVKTSVSGTHSGSFRNADTNRSYPFTYEVAAGEINTWVKKEVTVPGDTSGTWNSTANGIGIVIGFDLGTGSTFRGTAGTWASTNFLGATGSVSPLATINATWFITGVQLEVGSVATPFEHRSYGDELTRCHRYYYSTPSTMPLFAAQYNGTNAMHNIHLPTTMRDTPSTFTYSQAGGGSFSANYTSAYHCHAYYLSVTSSSINTIAISAEL